MAEQGKIKTVQANGAEMDTFRFGRGAGTLVIVPGLSVQSVMGAADAVAQAYASLADAYTLYLLDRRKDPPAAYSIHNMAEDTAGALRALGLEQADLFGASQGGMIAMELAIDHPELVRRLVLGSTAARVTEEQFALFDKWIRLAGDGDAEALYLSFGEALYPRAVFEASVELLKDLARTVTGEELRRFVVMAKALEGFDITDRLSGIACPTLVLGDEDDRVLGGEASRSLAERLGCELYMYDGYGHAAYDTAPDYKERIARFLS